MENNEIKRKMMDKKYWYTITKVLMKKLKK